MNFHENTSLIILKLLSEDFASKPKVKLDGRLSVEELCLKLAKDEY